MKKTIGISFVLITAILFMGCGKKEKEPNDNPSNVNLPINESSRETKEFEDLKDVLVFKEKVSNIEYEIKIFFEKEKAVNGVVTMVCPDEETAITMFSALYSDPNYEEIVRDGRVVSYDFVDAKFNYKGEDKEKVTQGFEGQGFKLVK